MTPVRSLPALGLLAALAVLPWVVHNSYLFYLLIIVAIMTVVSAGLNVLVGFSGQVSLGHAGFYAIGAYTGAILATAFGWNLLITLPLAAGGAAVIGAVLALPALAVSGPYLAMVTIAFGLVVESGLVEWTPLTGGPAGLFNIPPPQVLGRPLTLVPGEYLLSVGLAALALVLVRRLGASLRGKAIVAVRESPVAAASLGLDTRIIRTFAFTVSAAFAGAGGCLYGFLNGYISPDTFGFQTSILFLLIVIFGGLGTTIGPVVGAAVLIVLPELFREFVRYRLIIYGGLLLGSMYFLPRGVGGALERPGRRPSWARREPGPARAVALRRADAAPLEVRALCLAFGGLRALDAVDLTLEPGTIHAVIGPNGAGKTTLLNVLSGFYRPDAGTIRLDGEPLAGRPAHRVARAGIARTFQTTQLFDELTVLDNIAVGGSRRPRPAGAPGVTAGRRGHERAVYREAWSLLQFVGLASVADLPARHLPFGHRRALEIARALATHPRLLLLDEPAAGLTGAEIAVLDRLLAALREQGLGILLVEHHMDLVMGVSDRVSVLHQGRKIAEGTPGQVRCDPHVVEAYLGMAAGRG